MLTSRFYFFSKLLVLIFSISIILHCKNENTVNGDSQIFNDFILRQGDILIPRSNKDSHIEGGATQYLRRRWPKNKSNQYEVVYNITELYSDKSLVLGIYWVMEYLSRGSNILFRESTVTDTAYISFVNTSTCMSTLGYSGQKQYVSLGPDCHLLGTIAHELLHSLGFIHEHQRSDRDHYIDFKNPVQLTANPKSYKEVNFGSMSDSENISPYDVYSIMHYLSSEESYENGKFQLKNPADRATAKLERSFLTSCDWYTLNKLYPGPKKSPKCIPGVVPYVAEPTEEFVASENTRANAHSTCYVDDREGMLQGSCRVKGGEEFPDMPWVNEILQLPSRQVSLKKRNEFCSEYVDQTASTMKENNICYTQCQEKCPLIYHSMTLPNCMKYKFSQCHRIKRDLKTRLC